MAGVTGVSVLVVDDEVHIRRLLAATLNRAGYQVEDVATAKEALLAAQRHRPALVLLDLGLPDRDGLELVQAFKDEGVAVVVVSAREGTEDKVAALDLGADDYVTKPFDTEELLARIRAALRHKLDERGAPRQVTAGALHLDLAARRVLRDGDEVHLTRKEYDVLATLAAAPDRVVTHQTIMAAAWPYEHDKRIEYLRIVVRNLRQKIEADPARPAIITNELGVGYRLRTG
jgi:two-component system KDP operon response regulator KdpE